MSCLNLTRLLPPKKVWKLFKNKLPLKLLNGSKAIKKPGKTSYKSPKKLGWPPSLSVQPKKFKSRKNRKPQTLIRHKNQCCYKTPPPVFLDQLFVQPVSVVKEVVLPPAVGVEGGASKEKSWQSNGSKKGGDLESSKEERSGAEDQNMVSADEMWEAMELASPQMMNGIDERAEEFIARFRADMRHQEMRLARRL